MLRPLIESIYDYRMLFTPQSSTTTRNSYKHHYLESCAFIASENTLQALSQPNTSIENVISDWNSKHKAANKERKEGRSDYKSKLDEVFKNAGKNYYRARDYDRGKSRERSEDYKQSRHSIDSHHSYSRSSRDYAYGYHSQRYQHSYHKNDNYSIKYRNDHY